MSILLVNPRGRHRGAQGAAQQAAPLQENDSRGRSTQQKDSLPERSVCQGIDLAIWWASFQLPTKSIPWQTERSLYRIGDASGHSCRSPWLELGQSRRWGSNACESMLPIVEIQVTKCSWTLL